MIPAGPVFSLSLSALVLLMLQLPLCHGDSCDQCQDLVGDSQNNVSIVLQKAWNYIHAQCHAVDEKVKSGCFSVMQKSMNKVVRSITLK
jgi:hypothetical protein